MFWAAAARKNCSPTNFANFLVLATVRVIVRIRVRYWSSTASCFEMPPLCETTPHLTFLGAQAIERLDFLQWLAPVLLRGLKFFDSQFDSVGLEMSIFV